jgi:hypothetical protein
MPIPKKLFWIFWEVDPSDIDLERDANYVIARIVEHGTLSELRWVVRKYGLERIHRFFRDVGHPELSKRTLGFWRALFKASDERWAKPPSWRRRSAELWPG